MSSFKERWNINSNWQVFVIIVVFAFLQVSTSAFSFKTHIISDRHNKYTVSLWIYYPLYILLIFPVYQIFGLFGFIFGQFKFFWAFEKKCCEVLKLVLLLIGSENYKTIIFPFNIGINPR